MDLFFDVERCQTIWQDGPHSRRAVCRWLVSLGGEPLPNGMYRLRHAVDDDDPQAYVDAHLTHDIRLRLRRSTLHIERRALRNRPYWYVYFTHMMPRTVWHARHDLATTLAARLGTR